MLKQILTGERLVLKRNKANLKTAELMFALVNDNRQHLRPWFSWEALILKVEDSLKYLFENETKFKNGKKVEYGIYLNNKYIGNISIFNINQDDKSAEIGYWLSNKFLRQGYMTEALRVVEKELFTNFGLNRIQIRCDEVNKASAGLAHKCSYVFEGVLREDNYSKHFKRFRNTLVFSKLKKELKKRV